MLACTNNKNKILCITWSDCRTTKSNASYRLGNGTGCLAQVDCTDIEIIIHYGSTEKWSPPLGLCSTIRCQLYWPTLIFGFSIYLFHIHARYQHILQHFRWTLYVFIDHVYEYLEIVISNTWTCIHFGYLFPSQLT